MPSTRVFDKFSSSFNTAGCVKNIFSSFCSASQSESGRRLTLSLCLVSSEMLPLGESRVGVGGVTVISGGNLVAVEGMSSLGILGGIRERIRLESACFD